MTNLLTNTGKLTVWQLLKIYWQSTDRRRAYWGYAALVVLTTTVVLAELALASWSNYFYNALQAYHWHEANYLLAVFFGIAFTYVAVSVVRFYIWQLFGLNWRRWLTQQFMMRWLQGRNYYYLENFDVATDNPDQRIQDDIGMLIASSLNLSINLIGNLLSVIGFSYMLWHLSVNDFALSLGAWGTWHIHGYLMWVAVIYTFIGTLLTFKIGHPLVPLNFEQQHREATFRFAAIDLRSHAEHVALYRGEAHQQTILTKLFGGVLENAYRIILRETKLLSFTTFFGQLSVALPFIVVMPLYFHKVILLGGLMQSLRAFNGLQEALSFIVNTYSQIALWHATGKRLTTFANRLNHQVAALPASSAALHITQHAQPCIVTKQLTIYTPQQVCLLKNVELSLQHGRHYLLRGPSGIGKSTLIRVIAGIWPFATGTILLPAQHKLMYLPQKPYMPIGTLAEAVLFPDKTEPALVDHLGRVLQECHLAHLVMRLHEVASWSQQLSPGEQQRIAFARVLLHQPDWVFLDESTSMLDIPNEQYLYHLLKTQLPHCSLVSVGHRETLTALHDEMIEMAPYANHI